MVVFTSHGFDVDDVVAFRVPSIVNGRVEGYSPTETATVVRLARNGYLTVREPVCGTTFDVSAKWCELVK